MLETTHYFRIFPFFHYEPLQTTSLLGVTSIFRNQNRFGVSKHQPYRVVLAAQLAFLGAFLDKVPLLRTLWEIVLVVETTPSRRKTTGIIQQINDVISTLHMIYGYDAV
jgi:hypothetical protein